MSPINKQRFLTELGRLLTFMYEEDRTHELEMYAEIFDEVNNETAVLQLLVSPTRQAVNLARAYDARDRKFQDDGQEPAYQLVIDDIRRQAAMLMPAPVPTEDAQLSLFGDAEANDNVFESLGFEALPESHEENDAPAVSAPREIGLFPDEDRDGEPAPLSPPPLPVAEQNLEEPPAQEVNDFSDAVDAFLADFAIQDDLSGTDEPVQAPLSSIQDEDTAWENVPQRTPEKKEDNAFVLPAQDSVPLQTRQEENKQAVQAPRQEQKAQLDLPDLNGPAKQKANVPLLILFILLAIPVGLVCLAAILAFAVIFLGLSVLSLYVGINGLLAAFAFSGILRSAGLCGVPCAFQKRI